ncbi:DUF2214 family protein [Curvibacter gracilis]|uniref:DUF2214 family protein n=1 Tax=Curvibacter gracilis TaxID=230310 RepID=UPI0004850737|nr:DUF2214 family protein [Curvibacter gracilis]
MTLEALLASFHLLAILTLVVFLSSEAALCRPEWLNAAVVERLPRVDLFYGLAVALVLITGLARVFLGIKGAAWYGPQPLLHLKLGLFAAMGLLSISPSLAFRRWRRECRATGVLPDAAEVRRVRRLVMWQAHLFPIIPVLAVFWARGW